MAKAIVYEEGVADNTFEGTITMARTIKKDNVETNQPVITIEKEGIDSIDIEMTWGEAIELWDTITGFVGREIIKGRVEGILYGRDTCHYCGAPYNEEAEE
jgi:hypothetical protein